MADGRCCAEEAAATDLSRISGGGGVDADSRVPRERRKNRVDSSAAVGGCCRRRCCCSSCPISTTSTTTTPPSPLVPTSSSSPTTTDHRRRTIGDASDDRRRDGVDRAAGDGSRHNDNNENNARRDVASAANVAAVVAAEPPKPPAAAAMVGEAASALVGAKGGRAAAAAAAAATVVAAAAPSVVSRLEPAASEDPQRSGECVTDVVVAAGLAADDATSVARPRTEKTRRGRSTSGGDDDDDDDLIAPHDCDDDGYDDSDEYDCEPRLEDNKHRDDDTEGERAVVVSVGRGRAAASRAASGANGERNSEQQQKQQQQQQQHENVDNETRRGNEQRDDGKSPRNNANEREFRVYADEHEEGRRTGTRDGVLLVRRCINNNINNDNNKNSNIDTSNSSINNNNNRGNNNNSNTSAGGSYGGGVGVVSVRDSDSNDKARILGSDYGRERSTSDFTVRRSVKPETEVEEDIVSANGAATIMQTMQSMQTSDATTTTTTTTATATSTTEMSVDGRREDGMMTVEREIDEDGVVVVARLGRPFEGQIRTAEDDGHVGPCGKKRCADRYDSSESSDSGVAVSCGDCSSSGTSDITEPGSPCSTSSDEGVAGISRVAAPSPLPSLLKLAPTTPPSHSGTRPQWPWTPPLAATACSTYKRLKGEPEAGTLPKAGAADPTARSGAAGGGVGGGVVGISGGGVGTGGAGKQQTASGKSHHQQQQHHHHHESQGKITEYFKAQIKPQQPKLKKSATDMSLLVAKSSPEFRRPPTVQRNKGGLAKYLGVVLPNGRVGHEREGRTMTVSPPLTKKQSALAPRASAAAKLDKKQQLCSKVLQGLPLSSDVLAGLPSCKISSLRLTGEASPKPSGASPPATPTAASPLHGEPMMTMDYDEDVVVATTKPIVNENNNLTNGCATGQEHPMTRLSAGGVFDARKDDAATPRAADDDDDDEDEEDSTTSGQSKATSSPILSAPTTIRFPARAPEKKGPRGTDSGICRWDKCDGRFECSGALLEHLQAAHINTQQGGDNFVCHWQGCKVQGRTSCSRRWLERHVLSHGGNKPFRCIVDGCGSRFSSQTALERHVNSHFNQPETSSSSSRRSCESGGKLVRRNGKKLRYRRQPWSGKNDTSVVQPTTTATTTATTVARKRRKRNRVRASISISVGTARLFDYIDTGVMEGLQHRLVELAKTRTQGRLAETPGNSMALTSQVLARRVELDGKAKVLLRWYPQDIAPDEWVLESEVQSTKHIGIRSAATTSIDEVSLVLYPAVSGGTPPQTRTKQRRKPVKNS